VNEMTTALRPGEAPRNPYRGGLMEKGTGPRELASPYDERVKGLDGDSLDALLRARGTEGVKIGYSDGFNEGMSRWAEIYDQGYAAGRMDGKVDAAREVAATLVPHLRVTAESLAKIAATTGSSKVRELAEEAATGVTAALEAALTV